MSNDPLSPHTPSPLPEDADATVTGTDMLYLAGLQPQPVEWLWQHRLAAGTLATPGSPDQERLGSPSPPCAAPNSISASVAPKTENQVPGGGLCHIRRMSTRRATRQDAQINYLSTLSIFVKQTTYLATLPNPNLKANEFPHPQLTSRSRRQNPKNIFAIREWKCAQSGSKTCDHPIYGRPHRRAQRQYPRLPARKAPHTPPRTGAAPPRATHRLPRAAGRRLSALSAHVFPEPFSTRRRPYPGPPPPHRATSCPPGVQRHRPISSGSCSRHLTNC